MATACNSTDSAVRAMENELSCYICYNLLREPKDLDCPHVYCLLCLQDWIGEEPTIHCPECRHVTIVPPGGLSNLKTNLRLKNMVEMYGARVGRIGKKNDVPLCQSHEGERQHFFCETCGVTVCRDCLVLDHERPQHKIKELKVIAKTRKAEMKVKLDQVQAEINRIEDNEKKLEEIKRQLQIAKEQAESNVQKRVQMILAEVEAKGKETTQRIRAIYEERMKTVGEEENRIKERVKRLRNVCSAAQTVVDTVADHVYMKHRTSLVDKMEKLCIAQHDNPSPDVACIHFDSAAVPINTALLGKLENSHRERKLTLLTEFGQFQQAVGIAATKTGLLAVVDFESKEVVVYRDANSKYKHQFSLGVSSDNPDGKLILPRDVAVTSDNKFLVIDEGKFLKVFSVTGKYERKFSMPGGTCRIAITSDDTIVICNSTRETINMYNLNGELLRTHQVDPGKINSISTNGKQIAFTKPMEDKLRVIDFESGRNAWTTEITWPMGICLDDKSNSVLVAGNSKTRGNIRMEQYCNTTGGLVSHLASGLFNPLAMTFTRDDRLAVADWKTVKVYNIQ